MNDLCCVYDDSLSLVTSLKRHGPPLLITIGCRNVHINTGDSLLAFTIKLLEVFIEHIPCAECLQDTVQLPTRRDISADVHRLHCVRVCKCGSDRLPYTQHIML